MMPTTYPENKSSILLSKEENEQVFKLVGYKCITLATTVVQLFETEGPECIQWVKKDAGVLCLVRDTNKRSYFFRLFCLIRNQMVWEHEIYNNMQYLAPRSFLYTFEGEERIIAFNFACQKEAAHMRSVLLVKLEAKEQKRQERKCRNQRNPRNLLNPPLVRPAPTPSFNAVGNGFIQSKRKSSKSINSGGITKDDIGVPLNFRHVSHIGFDKNMGFKMNNVDDTMRQFFEKVGISENDLKDKETLEYIYDFIEEHGGYDAVERNVFVQPSPPSPPPMQKIPSKIAPSKSSSVRLAPPPHPPFHAVRTKRMHPTPPPPPVNPPRPTAIIQKNKNYDTSRNAVLKSDMFKRASQPPPPPPLPSANSPESLTIALTTNSNSAVQNPIPDAHSALMEAIRSGTSLKHVETKSKKPSTDNSRNNLLSQLRQGVELKPVPPVSKTSNLSGGDLANALARALAYRKERMHSDSSASSDSDDLNQEWDD